MVVVGKVFELRFEERENSSKIGLLPVEQLIEVPNHC